MIRVRISTDSHDLRTSLGVALSREIDMEVIEASPRIALQSEAIDRNADVVVLLVPWQSDPSEAVVRCRRRDPAAKIIGHCMHASMREELLAGGADEVVDGGGQLGLLIDAIRRVTEHDRRSTG